MNWWEPAFKDYTPSKDIADSFENMVTEEKMAKADLDWGTDIDLPEDDEAEPISQADTDEQDMEEE